MKRSLLGAITAILATAMVSGCWSRHELNDLAVALGVGIDKQGGKYMFSAQIVIPETIAAKKASTGTPAAIIQESGSTVSEAFRRMTTKSSRKVYLSHLRALVISEDVAREGIGLILDFFKRNRELRPDFYVMISKGMQASQALSIMPRLEKVPADSLFRSLAVSEKEWAPTKGVFLDGLLTDITTKGKEAVLPGLRVIGDLEQGKTQKNTERLSGITQIKYTSLGVFKKDKLIGWLDENESKGFNYITDHVTRTSGWIPCGEGKPGNISIDVMRSNGRIKGFVKNGKPQIEVSVWMEGSVGEVGCALDLTKVETIYQLEKQSEKKLTRLVEEVIYKVQNELKSDIFGFGLAINQANPKYWKKVEDHWDKEFVKLKVIVKTDIRIRRTGAESNSFITELDQKE